MILPPATLGVLGGGQLGRYFVLAAQELGYRVVVLDPDAKSVAARAADQHIQAHYDDKAALDQLCELCAAITTEFENVPAQTLAYLAQRVPVRPNADAVSICQNRSEEKAFLVRHAIPIGEYADIRTQQDICSAADSLFPAILKVVRFGYDGKGQVSVQTREEALAAFAQFNEQHCVLEKKLALTLEASVVLARDSRGQVVCYPPAQNVHRNGILDISTVPAPEISPEVSQQLHALAQRIAEKMAYVGTLAVEFFFADGRWLVNEIAPRPHNSGHYTLDACETSQYEQQVRALCDLPLGTAQLHTSACMINLLGDMWFDPVTGFACDPKWQEIHAVPQAKLHMYGKETPRKGRKMGHFTVVGSDIQVVEKTALRLRRALGIGSNA